MREIEKPEESFSFWNVYMSVDDLLDVASSSVLAGEEVRLVFGRVELESLKEIDQYRTRITLPLQLHIGDVRVAIGDISNSVYGPSKQRVRIEAIRDKMNEFRSPYTLLNGFFGFVLVFLT